MKAIIFFVALLVIFIGCAPQQSEQLTQQQKDQIKQELKVLCDTIWAKACRLDGEACFKYFLDSPELVGYNADGSRSDYPTMKKMMLDMSNMMTSMTLATTHEDFNVLSKDVVVYTWSGKSEAGMKTGEKMKYNPDSETFVFNKINGQWKIVFVQESASIVTEKAAKK